MRIARSVEEAADFAPSVLTIGKFDGVHAGHSHLLGQVVTIASERNLKAAAMTFHPHPACIVAPERAPQPLTSLEERSKRMRALGIEQLFILPFTPEVARLTPEEFALRFIASAMKARVVLVGENFRFGHRQAGDPRVLAELGKLYGFETLLVGAVKRRGLVASASEIRKRVEAGQVSLAGRLLQRPYAISGDVVPGHGIGARQTVPTLNLRPADPVLPANGVYITRTTDIDGGGRWNSITNIGVRPTFGGGERSIETFLLSPLEGETPTRIRLEFLRRVRDERKFESPEALKRQILSDVDRAQTYFRRVARFTAAAAG